VEQRIKVVSGGQTGVDRAALDAALYAGLECGGWCPRGRRAEDGPIDPRYPLDETPSETYAQRTEWNVRDSDGTLILAIGELTGGTKLTVDLAERWHRTVFTVDVERAPDVGAAAAWLRENAVRVLNVAGPRESTSPGIYDRARGFLDKLLGSCP